MKTADMNPITSFLVLIFMLAGFAIGYWVTPYRAPLFFVAAAIIALSLTMANAWQKFVILRNGQTAKRQGSSMLRNVNDLKDFAIQATDGTIGRVTDLYFDDEMWVIRYLVVDTGTWLSSKKSVLISPIAIGHANWTDKVLPVSITKEQVKNSPDIDTEKPVSRQHEIRLNGYYGYPYYWGGAGLWGAGTYPTMLMPSYDGFVAAPHALRVEALKSSARAHPAQHQDDDPHLRDCKAVMTYHVQAADGDIGHVQGLLVDEESWAIRYIVVDTSKWWLGHQLLIAPRWIENVSDRDATVSVSLTQQALKDAPPYDSAVKLDRQQQVEIHDHYGRRGYWAREATPEAAALLL